ncbi:SapC family protein [Pseudomonas sp. MMS21-TM103]|uniref:SapC family protein n=1 Tax=Pseudomonas sp. MMS21 TM103 TaxID=2886506 RepID=UPI001EDF83F8|nr:SapC family protein [Pseudomonas sp. MMS21 TM103]MCG4454284.1 SapC family protein [Pseudomonas sp. MMS21 TM103]
MTTQQLIYETAVPVNSGRHAQCSVDVGSDYSFVRNLNSLPLMAVEFPLAASDYAIVFAGSADTVTPVVILGVRGNENLFLSKDGAWQAKYIPAFVRRYPFVFSSSADEKTFTLCIDEKFPGLNSEGRGQPLFNEDGKATPYVDGVLKFLQDYRGQHLLTQQFCKKLIELELLEPMEAQFTLGSGEKMSLNGFMVVNRKKLNELPGEVLSELAKTDQLELTYLHLQSMHNFNAVKDRLVLIHGGKGDADKPGGEAVEAETKATDGKGAKRKG